MSPDVTFSLKLCTTIYILADFSHKCMRRQNGICESQKPTYVWAAVIGKTHFVEYRRNDVFILDCIQ